MTEGRHLEEHPMQDLSQAPLEPWVRGEMPAAPASPEWTHRLRKRVRFTDIYSECRKEVRYLTNLRERAEAGLPGPGLPPREGGEPSSQDWLIAQFQGFLQQLQEKLAAVPVRPEPLEDAAEAPRPRIRPVRTPRSDVPIQSVKPAELLRPEFSKRRLYFSCPCCHFPAVLPSWLAGKKARCPRCYSALRAPHPRKGLNTRVLENDVESILHPERFAQYYRAHRLIPWLGVPMPKFHPAFHGAGIAVLVLLLAFWIPSLIERATMRMQGSIAVMPDAATRQGPGFKQRARDLVEQFLAAENVQSKSVFVRDATRVMPLMSDWYRRHDGGSPVTARTIEVSGTGFYSGENTHPVSEVRVDLPGGRTAHYTVEHLPEGDCIEWESSVGYSAHFPTILERGPGASPQPVRVMAALDDYYNFSFTDASTHICVRLHDPVTMELLGFGYVPARADFARALVEALAGSDADNLRPLMLEVKAAPNARQSRQVNITRLIQSGWRSGSGLVNSGARK